MLSQGRSIRVSQAGFFAKFILERGEGLRMTFHFIRYKPLTSFLLEYHLCPKDSSKPVAAMRSPR